MAITGDAQIREKITGLKKELRAVIVAHNYQRPEVQDVADFVGDSLELARQCRRVDAGTIVFCGVRFMAETAAILNPDRTVLLAEGSAGCPLADMITAGELEQWQQLYPRALVVSYVNSPAEIKAASYICCTSANGVQVVESVPGDDILFVPDQNLGHFISTQTRKNIILYPGFCIVHHRFNPQQVEQARRRHPGARVIVHPECRPEVINLADAALSTSGMIGFARRTDAGIIIVGTEIGILHRLRKENPNKRFLPASERAVCPNMKKITLEKILWSLEELSPEVKVPEETRLKAKLAVDRMLKIGRAD